VISSLIHTACLRERLDTAGFSLFSELDTKVTFPDNRGPGQAEFCSGHTGAHSHKRSHLIHQRNSLFQIHTAPCDWVLRESAGYQSSVFYQSSVAVQFAVCNLQYASCLLLPATAFCLLVERRESNPDPKPTRGLYMLICSLSLTVYASGFCRVLGSDSARP